MALRISGKNMDVGEALRGQIQTRVGGALSKYFDGGFAGHVTIEREGTGYRTDCVVHLDSGVTLEATGKAHDAYVAFDQTAERIEKRLRRYKRRLKDKPAGAANGAAAPLQAPYAVLEPPGEEHWDEEEGNGAYHPVVIAESTRDLHRFSVSEAVLELEFTGAPVILFQHASTGRVNVVYRRRDGAVGWVDPPER